MVQQKSPPLLALSLNPSDLYARYLLERQEVQTLSCALGFVTFKILADHLHIIDVYVLPEARSQGVAFSLCQEVKSIGEESGCTHIFGQVDCKSKNPSGSLKAFMKMGMDILEAKNDMIYIVGRI